MKMDKNTTNAFRESYLEAQKYKNEVRRLKWKKTTYLLFRFSIFIIVTAIATQYLTKSGDALSITNFLNENKTPFIILPIATVLIAGLIGVLSSKSAQKKQFNDEEYNSLRMRIYSLQKSIDSYREQQGILHNDVTNYFDEDGRNELFDTIYNRLKSEASGELLSEFEQRIKSNTTLNDVKEYFLAMQSRLYERTNSLNTISFINLFIGISIAALGISILLFFVFNTDYAKTDKTILLIEMLSKLGVSLGIELLSFFFLNLYRKNLQEIKYIQNELTNIEAKKISLTMAHDLPTDLRFKIIKSISMTERNFILEKGQTTTDLETLKYERIDIASLIKSSPDIIKALKETK